MQNRKIVNIASHLTAMAEQQPDTTAIAVPSGHDSDNSTSYVNYTFKQLDIESSRLAYGLQQVGVKKGVRTVMMVMPGFDYFALVFALFKVGAVTVMIDPGMGMKNLKKCLEEAGPEAFIGIPKAHVARMLLRWGAETIRIKINVGGRLPGMGISLNHIRKISSGIGFKIATNQSDEVAAILFTSGSTGVPKGVVYTHNIFLDQVDHLKKMYHIEPGEIDLPTFPLFALFDPALGMTTIIPEMDFTRPATADPVKLISAIKKFGVTNMFGSPAVINLLGRYGKEHDIKLPTLKRAISAGAPVPSISLERFSSMLRSDVHIHTPYGATESLPVSTISSDTVLNETRLQTDKGHGVCVGKPVEGIHASIIQIVDTPIANWSEVKELPVGQIGEIVVKGSVVTRDYFNREESTKLAKIHCGTSGEFYHRMGDVGYLDDKGRIWFCGRKGHRVITKNETLFTIPCEAIFNVHQQVFRSALVGVTLAGTVVPVICIELEKGVKSSEKERIGDELFQLAKTSSKTEMIKKLLFSKAFPVDVRHNSKIFREKLAVWAAMSLN